MAETTYEESRIETFDVAEIMKEVNEQLNETLQPWKDAIQKITRNNSIYSDAVKNKAMEIRERLPRVGNNRRNNNSPSPSPAGRRHRSSGGSKKMRKHKTRKHRTRKHIHKSRKHKTRK